MILKIIFHIWFGTSMSTYLSKFESGLFKGMFIQIKGTRVGFVFMFRAGVLSMWCSCFRVWADVMYLTLGVILYYIILLLYIIYYTYTYIIISYTLLSSSSLSSVLPNPLIPSFSSSSSYIPIASFQYKSNNNS